jgi:glyoxylase-like metal-dependent hydrolase (beta-lactamase superfamily II)
MTRFFVTTLVTLLSVATIATEKSNNTVKLYALNCGTTQVSDMKDFSVKGKMNGEKETLIVPCYLIRHPKGDLLWDTGHDVVLATMPDGFTIEAYHLELKTTLTEQLKQLSLSPLDIEYLSLSHSHTDHSGNANLFSSSTFIINELEHKIMFSDENKLKNQDIQSYAALEKSKTILFKNVHDVFDDKTVMIKSMPGHTPGSSVLLVRLMNSGNLLLTGDLYTHERARTLDTISIYNSDQLATIESREKFEKLAIKEKARVVIQHSMVDFTSLPAFPDFLD